MSDELVRFRKELLQDISAIQLSEDEGGSAEQIFTHIACELLIDAGETENVRVAYDEGQLRTRNQHKINGYGEPDNYETVDLFITAASGKIAKLSKGKFYKPESTPFGIFNLTEDRSSKIYWKEMARSRVIRRV